MYEKHSFGRHEIVSKSNQIPDPEILVLHGAGKSDMSRVEFILDYYEKKQIGAITFDFVGHGQSTGELSKSSLSERRELAEFFLNMLSPKSRTVMAFSMSGHTAISLLNGKDNMIKNLALFCPGLYHDDNESLKFNQGFSDVIRTEKSYLKASKIFNLLRQFRGNLFLVKGELDEVIPDEVIDKILLEAEHARKKLSIPTNSVHQMAKWLTENPEVASGLMEEINIFMNLE